METEFDHDFKPRVFISEKIDSAIVWLLLIIAFLSVFATIYYFRNEVDKAWFEDHSRITNETLNDK